MSLLFILDTKTPKPPRQMSQVQSYWASSAVSVLSKQSMHPALEKDSHLGDAQSFRTSEIIQKIRGPRILQRKGERSAGRTPTCALEAFLCFRVWASAVLGSRVELAMGGFAPVKDCREDSLPSSWFTSTVSMLY